jgi:hypothetical protein
LLEVIDREAATPFTWGESDCLTFAIGAVRAMLPELELDLPAYEGERGAARALLERGFRDVGEALASRFEEIPPAWAHRGDLGIVQNEEATTAVVFVGPYVVGKDKPGGLRHVWRGEVTRAFRVSL